VSILDKDPESIVPGSQGQGSGEAKKEEKEEEEKPLDGRAALNKMLAGRLSGGGAPKAAAPAPAPAAAAAAGGRGGEGGGGGGGGKVKAKDHPTYAKFFADLK